MVETFHQIDRKQQELLSALRAAGEEYERYYRGHGVLLSLWRFIHYPDKFIVRVLSRVRMLSPQAILRAETFWGRNIWVRARDKNAAPLYYFGILSVREQKLASFFIRHMKSSDVFYDVGASYGFYTVLAEALIADGAIRSFEPLPTVFSCLAKTIEGNSRNVTVHNLALSNISGPIAFYDGLSKGWHSGASTMVEKVAARHPERYRAIQIESMRLDDFVNDNPPPTIIKIDVEGGEAVVLEGGGRVLKSQMPCVIMEVWGRELWDSISSHAVRVLIEWGYTPYLIDDEGNAQKADETRIQKEVDRIKYDNIVFMR